MDNVWASKSRAYTLDISYCGAGDVLVVINGKEKHKVTFPDTKQTDTIPNVMERCCLQRRRQCTGLCLEIRKIKMPRDIGVGWKNTPVPLKMESGRGTKHGI